MRRYPFGLGIDSDPPFFGRSSGSANRTGPFTVSEFELEDHLIRELGIA
jgi:hypothetical protein